MGKRRIPGLSPEGTMDVADAGRWLFSASKGVRRRVGLNALLGLMSVAASLLFVWAGKELVDMATNRSEAAFVPVIALMVFCLVLQLVLSAVNSRMDVSTQMNFANRLRARVFSHIMHAGMATRKSIHTADTVNRMEQDVSTVTGLVCATIPGSIVSAAKLIGAFIFLAVLDWRLALLAILIMPLAFLVSKVYFRRTRALTRTIRGLDSKVQTHLQEFLQHRTLVSTLERTDDSVESLEHLQNDLRRTILSRTDLMIFSRSAVTAGFMAGYLLAFIYGAYGILEGTVTFGMMTAFLQLVAQVQRPVVDLGGRIPAFVHSTVSVERLVELLELPAEATGKSVELRGPQGVRLENVSFSYPDDNRKVIDGLSFDFAPGTLTAVTGETGAGKSTLVRLLLALLHPDSGKIVYYDKSIEAEASPLTRGNIVYVPQGNSLISGTIRRNLLMGDPDADEERIREALLTAEAGFVYDFPQGIDTVCTELGSGLSEGQAQRIAIARGLLRPGGIVLLDEPTSALDPATERKLLRNLEERLKGKTVIIVTHRQLTAEAAGRRLTIGAEPTGK